MNLLEDRSDRRRRPDHQSSKRVHDGEANLKTPGGIRTRTPMCISG